MIQDFAQRLAHARKERRLSGREICRRCDLYRTMVSDIESGRIKRVSVDVAGMLADVLGISKSWLCWGEGGMEKC